MKKLKSPADRLILLVVRHRERATVRNIARSHLTGADLGQAKKDSAGLVTWEWIYQISRQTRYGVPRRSRRPSLTARLTHAGLWRAARLGVPYDSSLTDAVLAESDNPAPHSRAEKELLAEQASYKADALEYRRQLAARKTAKDALEKKTLMGPRRKRSSRHYERLAAFLATRKKLSAFPSQAELQAPVKMLSSPSAPRLPVGSTIWRPELSRPPEPAPQRPMAPKEVCSFCGGFKKSEVPAHDCLPYMVPARLANFTQETGPTIRTRQGVVPDIPPDSRKLILERAKTLGYPTRHEVGREFQVMYESRWISAQEWAGFVPEK